MKILCGAGFSLALVTTVYVQQKGTEHALGELAAAYVFG